MTRRFGSLAAAFVAVPLLALAIALPSGLDSGVSPLVAGAVPLSWAIAVAGMAALDSAGFAAALGSALPFSAYAVAAFGSRPAALSLVALVSCAVAAVAVRHAARRNGFAAAIAFGAAPGVATMAIADPLAGIAVSLLVTASALYVRARRQP